MTDLFDAAYEAEMAISAPLADRMRPRTLAEFIGQEAVVGAGTILRRAIENDEVFSMILWGPPGSGKTTLAQVIAKMTKSIFVQLSGVTSSKDDLLKAVKAAEERRKTKHQRTILFVDEIHRWNKAQQDALLPYVERGVVTLVGATTENPSFEVISPLLSRAKVFVLDRLTPAALVTIVEAALADAKRGYGGQKITVAKDGFDLLSTASNGDARTALNTLELAVKATPATKGKRVVTAKTVAEAFQQPQLLYDKKGEEHYNIISAFIKSLRGSQPDAALYWLGRMVEAGEDPMFIARRMVIFASEDIGVANAEALPLAVACMQACDMIGLPECSITLSHTAVYLATSPKSNETYTAYQAAVADVKKTLNQPVPLNLRNAPTKLMKELGYHRGYKYSHNYEGEEAAQDYLPASLAGQQYYIPKMNAQSRRAVSVIPYRRHGANREIWIGYKRSAYGDYWQCIQGAVEAGESPRRAASRELHEETNINVNEPRLVDLHWTYPVDHPKGRLQFFAFAYDAADQELTVGEEHREGKWVSFDEALKTVKFDTTKTAIQKLNDLQTPS